MYNIKSFKIKTYCKIKFKNHNTYVLFYLKKLSTETNALF